MENPQVQTAADEALHQQTLSRQMSAYSPETKGIKVSVNDDEGDKASKGPPQVLRDTFSEDLQEDTENAGIKTCKTEEEQGATPKEPDDEFASGPHSHKLWDDYNEDRVAAGQPLAPECSNKVRTEAELGGGESDEDMGYFQKGPQGEHGMNAQGNRVPEEEREGASGRGAESDDLDYKEDAKDVKEADSLTVLSPREDRGPCQGDDGFDFQSLEELVFEDAAVEEAADKVKDFTGDDHQEAGETFAEFPPDFSSWGDGADEQHQCNLDAQLSASSEMSYLDRWTEPTPPGTVNIDSKQDQDVCPGWTETAVDAKRRAFSADNKRKSNTHPYAARTTLPERCWSVVGDEGGARPEDEDHTQDEKGIEGATDAWANFVSGPQTIQYIFSSSDDEIQGNTADGEHKRDDSSPRESAPAISLPSLQTHLDEVRTIYEDPSLANICATSEAPAGCEDYAYANMPLFFEDPTLNTEDVDMLQVASKDPYNTDAQGDTHLTTWLSNQGSADDGFFFTQEDEISGIAELGHFGDDEYEDERNWDQEQERIQAFYEFYNDNNGDIDQEGRKTKVHFCTDLLSQVIHYDSVEDSFDSSTEEEDEIISSETCKEMSGSDTPTINSNLQLRRNVVPEHVAGLRNTKCIGLLKTILQMSLVIGMGLLVLWWSMDQTDVLGLPIFKG